MRNSAAILTTASTIAAFLVLGLAFAKQNGAATPRIQVLPNDCTSRRHRHRRQTLHLLYLARKSHGARPLSTSRLGRHRRHSRLSLDPRPGERVDHPHHVGIWFNYGNVNDFDFWNNSYAIKKEDAPKMGNVLQRKIVTTKGGNEKRELTVETDWISGTQKFL